MVYLVSLDATPQAAYQAPAVLATTSTARTIAPAVKKLEFGICNSTYANLSDASQAEKGDLKFRSNRLSPAMYAYKVLSKKRHDKLFGFNKLLKEDAEWLNKWEESLNISVLRAPAHGKLTLIGKDIKDTDMLLTPDVNYIGKDRVDLLVEGKDDLGRPFAQTLRYYINVVGREWGPGLNATKHFDPKELCGTAKNRWRISEVNPENEVALADRNDPTAWLQSAQLSALIASATFQGTATSTGPTASITLDPNERCLPFNGRCQVFEKFNTVWVFKGLNRLNFAVFIEFSAIKIISKNVYKTYENSSIFT